MLQTSPTLLIDGPFLQPMREPVPFIAAWLPSYLTSILPCRGGHDSLSAAYPRCEGMGRLLDEDERSDLSSSSSLRSSAALSAGSCQVKGGGEGGEAGV